MHLKMTVLTAPQGKARARTITKGNRTWSFTPHKTEHLENVIRDKVVETGVFFPGGTPISLEAWFYFEKPKSAPKKRTYPTVIPDADNCIKLLSDSLRGYLYKDDAQIVDMVAHKRYESPARICFEVRGVV